MSKSRSDGLASIIIPCWNQLTFTRHCLQSVFRHTRRSFELIVVDNGSTDGTGAYLAGVADAARVPVTVIANPTNQGFPAAINQGLRAARGDYLVLLNNDVVVTDGWLDQLIALAEMRNTEGDRGREESTEGVEGIREGTTKDTKNTKQDESRRCQAIGLVGPMSNYAVPPQLVENVPYRDLEEMQAFARRWRDEHRGQWLTAGKLSGFCLLMKRAVYEAIGGLDERFGLGFFDDDDLALRANRAGFELAVAHDLFVHHFGSRTFQGNGVDAEKLLEENGRRFAEKWGEGAGNGQRVMLRPWQGNSEFHARTQTEATLRVPEAQRNQNKFVHKEDGNPQFLAPFASSSTPVVTSPVRRVRVSLTMIVRNEAANLPACLASVAGLFDEIVVVDTGSVDRTKQIAREFGARVFDFAWIDDFAAARNAALAHATGDYAFWLDGDDVLDPHQRGKMSALLDGLRPGDEAAYVVRCACDGGRGPSLGITVVDHIRLFPLRDDVQWTYRVHEQILPSLRRADIPVRWTDLVVRHTGYADLVLRFKKLDRDAKILLEELAKRPQDPFVLFNLGSIAVEREQWPAALNYLQGSMAGTGPMDSIRRKLHALIARSYQMLGDLPAALRACEEGLSIDSEDAELWFRKAVVHRHRGERDEAETSWRRILKLRPPERFSSIDVGIYGHLTRRNLAVLAEERADHAGALCLWREVLAECPGDAEAEAHFRRVRAAESTGAGGQ